MVVTASHYSVYFNALHFEHYLSGNVKHMIRPIEKLGKRQKRQRHGTRYSTAYQCAVALYNLGRWTWQQCGAPNFIGPCLVGLNTPKSGPGNNIEVGGR